MKTASRKRTAANLRSRRVVLIRSKGEYLDSVEQLPGEHEAEN
jgi:hypothetical protein